MSPGWVAHVSTWGDNVAKAGGANSVEGKWKRVVVGVTSLEIYVDRYVAVNRPIKIIRTCGHYFSKGPWPRSTPYISCTLLRDIILGPLVVLPWPVGESLLRVNHFAVD